MKLNIKVDDIKKCPGCSSKAVQWLQNNGYFVSCGGCGYNVLHLEPLEDYKGE